MMFKKNLILKRYQIFIFTGALIFSLNGYLSATQVITLQEELDLELFQTPDSAGKPFIQLVDKTITVTGKKTLKNILQNPLVIKQSLEQRQKVIQELIDPTILHNITQELTHFKQNEHALNSLWLTPDPIQKAALEEFYFSISSLQPYNGSPALLSALQVLNIGNLFGPLIEHALLHFFISNTIKEKYHIGCTHNHTASHEHLMASPASLLVYNIYNAAHFSFHLMGIKGIYDHIKQKAFVIKNMQASLIGASKCVQSMRNLYRIAQKNSLLSRHFSHYQDVTLLFETPEQLAPSDSSVQLINLLETNTFKGNASLWSNIGNVLAAYHLIENADALQAAFKFVGEMDAHASIATLYTENKDKDHYYTFAYYENLLAPHLQIANVWNPHLGSKNCPHTMELGSVVPNNSIITGDNAAGKSTTIKSIALAILLGQTFTIVPADTLHFTPFVKISSFIKHADNIQAGTSLFISETLKAQALIDSLETMQETEFSFAIFDELFKSTSFEKGQKTAYELIELLGCKYPHNLTLVATHYSHLTDLQNQYPALFKNYLSQAITNSQGITSFELKPEETL